MKPTIARAAYHRIEIELLRAQISLKHIQARILELEAMLASVEPEPDRRMKRLRLPPGDAVTVHMSRKAHARKRKVAPEPPAREPLSELRELAVDDEGVE